MSISDNIQVFVRVRPLNTREVAEDPKSCLSLYPKKLTVDTKDGKTDLKTYNFDWIASESSTQQEIFEVIGKPMADTCLQGYNCCIFAYGQTGAGKTYTMQGRGLESGDEVHCGLEPRILDYIFALKAQDEAEHPDVRYSITCGYLEIYNEQIIDLFNPSQKALNVREDLKEGIFIENLKEIKVSNSKETLRHLQLGARNRHVGSTNMNLESSRSHSLFIMTIQRKTSVATFTSKFNFVDLAGSERQKNTSTTGALLKEAGNINKSLSVLGKVINSLVETAEGKVRHTPYRDSKLTFILRDSLGGNSKTCLIANVSPAASSIQDTISTLKFAQRAKQIKNKALINENRSELVEELQRQLERKDEELREANEEITALKTKLSSKICDCTQSTSYQSSDESNVKIEENGENSQDQQQQQQSEENMQSEQMLNSQREAFSRHELSENCIQRITEHLMTNLKSNDDNNTTLKTKYLELKKEKRRLQTESENLKKENAALLNLLNKAPLITESCLWWEKGNQNLAKTSEVNAKLNNGMHQLYQVVQTLQTAAEAKAESLCRICREIEAEEVDMEIEESTQVGEKNPIVRLQNMLKKQQSVSQERLAEVVEKNKELFKIYEEKDQELKNLEEKNQQLLKTCQELRLAKLNDKETEEKCSQDQQKELQVNNLSKERQQLAEKLSQKELQVSHLTQEKQELAEKLSQKDLQVHNLIKEKQDLVERFSQKGLQLSDFIQEKQDLVDKISRRDHQLEKSRKKQEDLAEELSHKSRQVDHLVREKRDLVAKLSRRDEKLDLLVKEKEEISQKLEQKSEELTSSLQSYKSELQEESTKSQIKRNKTLDGVINRINIEFPKLNNQLFAIMCLIDDKDKFGVRSHYTTHQTLDQFKICFPILEKKIKKLLEENRSRKDIDEYQKEASQNYCNMLKEQLPKILSQYLQKNEDDSLIKAPENKNPVAFSSLENKENIHVRPPSREGKVSASTSVSKSLNEKRSFDVVGEGFKDDSARIRSRVETKSGNIEKGIWDDFGAELVLTKKLKNN